MRSVLPLVAKVDLVLLFAEKSVPGLHGILPLGGDHVMQFGILAMAATVIDDGMQTVAEFIGSHSSRSEFDVVGTTPSSSAAELSAQDETKQG